MPDLFCIGSHLGLVIREVCCSHVRPWAKAQFAKDACYLFFTRLHASS